jgi:hypothetical protein
MEDYLDSQVFATKPPKPRRWDAVDTTAADPFKSAIATASKIEEQAMVRAQMAEIKRQQKDLDKPENVAKRCAAEAEQVCSIFVCYIFCVI